MKPYLDQVDRRQDHWSGQERRPATLSGGETLLVSLCLALGLSDVVLTEADGTQIGSLFVDDGFGSLDQEALDQVLDALRSGGRPVGLSATSRNCAGAHHRAYTCARRPPLIRGRRGSGARLRSSLRRCSAQSRPAISDVTYRRSRPTRPSRDSA
ncbi:SbcC/MukB-like Walker B domain-containing protein [Micromonospora sp. NPDC020751]|uniref:SbcC/MukB-like Walker B domain-containing protein n=1 Tax=Micromonospora sp. NPDC020751 TaxID=3364240 RepID=UPI00378823CA